MFDLRRQEGGLVPPELPRRRLVHRSGPGSLKLLPCRGNLFVDLVVTMLQISEGPNQDSVNDDTAWLKPVLIQLDVVQSSSERRVGNVSEILPGYELY
jgi:hypothetical protein